MGAWAKAATKVANVSIIVVVALATAANSAAAATQPAQDASRTKASKVEVTVDADTVQVGDLRDYVFRVRVGKKSALTGVVSLAVPAGWTPPQKTSRDAAGYVTIGDNRCERARIGGVRQTSPTGGTVDLKVRCKPGRSVELLFQSVTAPTVVGTSRWQFTSRAKGSRKPKPLKSSPTIRVASGPPAVLAVRSGPTTSVAGSPFARGVVVAISDRFGNTTDVQRPVHLSATSSCGDIPLNGTADSTTVSGVATFTQLGTQRACPSVTLTASSPGLASAQTSSFTILPSDPSTLQIRPTPAIVTARQPIAPAVTVDVMDSYGNKTEAATSITLTAEGPCDPAATGATTVAAVSGTAVFDGVSIDNACNAVRLTARGPGLTPATTSTFEVAGTWTAAAGTPTEAGGAAFAALPDGRILIVGGYAAGGAGPSALASVYDPATRTVNPVTAAPTPRGGATAVVLSNGRVLVFAGHDTGNIPSASNNAVELYDPVSDTWKQLADRPPVSDSTYAEKAAVLSDGRVLVVPSSPDQGAAVTKLYDPAADSWTPAGQPGQPDRQGFTFTQLKDGRVLIVGGYGSSLALAPEIYDPATGTWGPTSEPRLRRVQPAAVLEPDGRVLVTGGYVDSVKAQVASSEYYDPATDTWSPGPNLSQPRQSHTTVVRTDGTVIAAGGYTPAYNQGGDARRTTDTFSPRDQSFKQAAPLTHDTFSAPLFALADNSVLLFSDAGQVEVYR